MQEWAAEGWPIAPPAPPARRPAGWDPGNRVLAALPLLDRALLAGEMEPISFAQGQSLGTPGEPVARVIFPASGVISLVAEPAPGECADVGLVGREDVLGLPALFGDARAGLHWRVRIGGGGHAIRLEALRARMRLSAALRNLLQRCVAARLAEAAQVAACAALHPLPRRLAGRLLAVQDRAGPGFEITQSTLAGMLNCRRPTVSTELQRLRDAGLVRHARGRIAVADRAGLERLACPCHAGMRQAWRSSMPPEAPPC
jgi:CRP-like cAMP-binding protein